ncbi:MAG: D-2-hydroxyacid dehydrogenase [Bacteroidales bacterium]|nr:D-2-hydroxyacid dehydrogenase [Bacteroidales bacterium]
MKIVFLDANTIGSDVSIEPISSLGDYSSYESSTYKEALERVKDCEVLIINKIKVDKNLIDNAPALRLICEAATGTNNIDVAYAVSKGIPVKNVAAYSTESVVQTTFMHILSLVGKSTYFDDVVKSGEYSAKDCFTDVSNIFYELCGKRLGIIGMGNIGSRVAQVGTAFGMQVSYYSTSGTNHCKDYPAVSLDKLLEQSDIVSIHAPLNDKTNNLLTYSKLCMMKKSACVVNMGRGGIVNEADLAKALDEGVIAGAATDVFVKEPIPADHPYLVMKHKERIRLSPHIGWASAEARVRLLEGIAKNIRDTFEL